MRVPKGKGADLFEEQRRIKHFSICCAVLTVR
uniref:Uncharacterized protein n=1 Tax=Anguilla anguilla TaxID=7936 RepID=A0A0E9TKA4_ANGAN